MESIHHIEHAFLHRRWFAPALCLIVRGSLNVLFLIVVVYLLLGLIPGQSGKDLQQKYTACLRFLLRMFGKLITTLIGLLGSLLSAIWHTICWCFKTVFSKPPEKKT